MEECSSARVAAIIPTLNGGRVWRDWLTAFSRQKWKPSRVLVIDSTSEDNTVIEAESRGLEVRLISRASFDHGGTRNLGAEWIDDVDILVYLTQDAILASEYSLQRIVAVFDDPSIGVAYGRQLPRKEATPIEAHARLFNYPPYSEVRDLRAVPERGIKTAFCSNSFAAYRRDALMAVGGFPEKNIVSEDMYVVAKMLLARWRVAYCADATVFHSHNYGYLQELRRYFDIGVFQSQQPWIREKFGTPGGEGLRFIRSELKYLLREKPSLIPSALLRTSLKLMGYKLGLRQNTLPLVVKKKLSMHAGYWQ